MEKQKLLEELKVQFDLTQNKLKFKSSFQEINKICFIEDMVLSSGFVSNQFSRQMINRLVETFSSWMSQMYSWAFPSPTDAIQINESKKLSSDERKEIVSMIDHIMFFVRKNKRIAFKGNLVEEEAEFIDELTGFYLKIFRPCMLKYHEKFELVWKEELDK